MKTCSTCNASHKNTVERVLRCGLCVARASGNSNWRTMGHNAIGQRGAASGASDAPTGCASNGDTEEE